ncbi:MAG: CBS domain-containing protein [Candidatus Nanoarchaeia archaeon]|jgi:predicted transcriptional regulator
MSYLPDLKIEVKRLRMEAGLTQKGLASGLGVNQSLISQIEAGSKNPSYELADQLFSYLHKSISKGLLVGEFVTDELVFVTPNESIGEAITKLAGDFDQLPVIDQGVVVGTLFTKDLIKVVNKKGFKQLLVKDLMGLELPVILPDESFNRLQQLLQVFDAVLVKKTIGYGIITRSDLISKIK